MTAAARLVAGVAAALVILAAGLFGGAAQAQMPGQQQVSLTPEVVDRMIQSMPDVRRTAEGLQAKYDTGKLKFGNDPAGRWQAWLAYSDASSALGQVCQKYGFKDFPSWVATFSSVAIAHAFARKGGGFDDQMAEAVEQIRNNPNMSDAQKEMMLKQIEVAAGSLGAMRPSQQNLDAVAPYGDQLEALFEDS